MSQLNILLSLNAYQDTNPTNHPSKSQFKWVSDIQGITIDEPRSSSVRLQPNQSLDLFSGEILISDNNTTTYNLALKAGTSNTYVITYNSGTAPVFRTAKTTGADATTQITVTKNATLLTFSSTGGTALGLILGGAIVGDEVRIGSLFNVLNQGKFKILSLTATSFTIANASGQAEGPITLGAGFASQISIYSANGVQVGNRVQISTGFSPVTLGTYEITDVAPNYLEFYSLNALPTENAILSKLHIYGNAKKFLYVESSQKISIAIDGVASGTIEPMVVGVGTKPGMLLKNSTMYSATITNNGTQASDVFFASAE